MLRLTMTRDELMKELSSDKEWVSERLNGVVKKYNRQLKSNRLQGIFHNSWYTTPNHNRVCVYYVKNGDLIGFMAYWRIIGDDGKVRYISISIQCMTQRLINCYLFTNHFLKRLKEREGKDYDTWFRERIETNNISIEPTDYTYNGDSKQCYAVINGSMVFGIYTDSFDVVFTTLINREQERGNQQDMHDKAFIQNVSNIKEVEEEIRLALERYKCRKAA